MSPFRVAERSRLVIAALLLLQIFCWIEVDLYAPSFPLIRQYFGTTEEMVSWTLSINFLGYFAASLVVGPLADSFGRRPVLLAGSGLFILGSVVCLLAPSLGLLYAGRLLQGVGVSAPTTLAATIVADVHDGPEQVKIQSLVSSIVTITMAAAPMAGAWLSARWGWRANFALILAGSLAATALTWLLVPETHGPERRPPFTLAGILAGYRDLLGDRFFLATSFGLMLLVAPYWIFIALNARLYEDAFRSVGILIFAVVCLGVPLAWASVRRSGVGLELGGAGPH